MRDWHLLRLATRRPGRDLEESKDVSTSSSEKPPYSIYPLLHHCLPRTLAKSISSGVINSHDAVEVHSVNTDGRVVLDSQIDVLGDTETEVTGLGEVLLTELVLLDLETTLDDLLGLGATDGDVDGDLLVTTDTEGTDGVAGLGVDGSLTRKLLEHLGGTGKPITGFTDGDVEN
jgi:hypothetical protein